MPGWGAEPKGSKTAHSLKWCLLSIMTAEQLKIILLTQIKWFWSQKHMRGSQHWCPCVLKLCSMKQAHSDPSSSGCCVQPKAALLERVAQLTGHVKLYKDGFSVVINSKNWEIKKNEEQQWAKEHLPSQNLSELQGAFLASVAWRDFAEEFMWGFSLHLQFQHLGDILASSAGPSRQEHVNSGSSAPGLR